MAGEISLEDERAGSEELRRLLLSCAPDIKNVAAGEMAGQQLSHLGSLQYGQSIVGTAIHGRQSFVF